MTKPNSNFKILWALDALEDLPSVRKKQIQILRSLAHRLDAKIFPVSVFSPASLGYSEETRSSWKEKLIPAEQKALSQLLTNVEIPGLQAPEVVEHAAVNLKGSVSALVEYSKRNSFNLLVVGTHGRSGFQRMIIGSFAEELLLQSEIPVLVIGNHTTQTAPFTESDPLKILVPHRLDEGCERDFDGLLNFSSLLKAQVEILQVKPRPVEIALQSGVYLLAGSVPPPTFPLGAMANSEVPELKQIQLRAESLGVQSFLTTDDVSASVTESVLKRTSESNANFIAMIAESGPVAVALLGSITRQIVRSSACPVLVFRTRRK